MLASEFGAIVSAITLSAAQYRYAIAQGRGGRNPDYLLGDWANNELPSGVFDAVISIESSEHMQEKPVFFAQAHRVLKADGRMVVCAWLAAENPTSAHRRHLLEPICREGRLPGMGSETDYRQWLAERTVPAREVRGCERTRSTDLVDLSRPAPDQPLPSSRVCAFLVSARARNRVFL